MSYNQYTNQERIKNAVIMDYKDVSAIGIVRLMLTDGVITVEQAANYFPELKESEDEKIRKGLIDYFNNFHLQTFAGLDPKKILTWLEKQGEWTIQDAKNGDILACNNDILSICIFSHFDGINNKYASFLCHCGLEGEGLGQELNINGYHDDSTGYVPATKRQRDLLFQKIKEAGYEWDAERKELKKIEKKTVL